jgi:hypothetical protein
MPGTCLHGLPASECLICKTLGTQPKVDVESSGARSRGLPSTAQPSTAQPRLNPAAHPDAVYAPERPPPRRGSVGTHIILLAAALLAIGVVVWIVAGAVIALLHVLELVAVAVVAAWAGYRLGFYRGRHRRP